ncbi:hypothetical protein I8H83_03000 [Candidatus Saccharibacteria bacterium]|nr:hypothetical protein [Candidatus Saccharibacteria bacterium]
MSFFWFFLAIVFFALWRSARSSNKNDQSANSYGQGYWDGYRAFGNKVSELLRSDEVSKHRLRQLVDEGNGVVADSAGNAAMPRCEELGIIPEGTDEYDDEPMEIPRAIYTEAVAPQPVLSTEDIAARKEKETLQNLNILLYVASFLIVAAAALFVTLVMPAGVKLFSLIFVTLAFYISGMALYSNSQRLRPAATAFVGTGLAILPFIGFALTSLGGFSGEVAWLITSIVGLLAYAVAATRLQSELVSYLTMAFVLSLALSAVSTLSLSIVWYFIVMIGVSLLCNSLHILWPTALPRIFAKPIEKTGQITTPIALVASLLTGSSMDLFMYEVLYGIATAHYLVVWLEKRERMCEAVVRVLAHITLIIVALDVTDVMTSSGQQVQFGVWMLVLALLQAGYSLLRVRPNEDQEGVQVERIFVVVSLVMLVAGMCWWAGDVYMARWTTLSLVVIGGLSLAATVRFREAGWAYVGLVASVALPYVLARGVFEPPVSYEVVAGGFTILALFALMGLERARALAKSQSIRALLSVAAGTYAALVAISGLLMGDGISIGWTMLLSGGIYVALSYLLKSVTIEIIGALFGIVSIIAWVNESSIASDWQLLVTIVVAAVLLVAGAAAHHLNGERERRTALAGLGAAVFACLVATAVTSSIDPAVYRTATALLLLASVAGVALRVTLKDTKNTLTQISRLVYFAYPLLGLIVAWQAGMGWVTLACVVYTGIFWIGSHVEKIPGVMIAGNVALVCALTALWYWLEFDSEWLLRGVVWLSAAIFYAIYWLMVSKKDEWRQLASLVSVWVVLGLVALAYVFASTNEFVLAAAGSLLAIALTLGVHGHLQSKTNYVEAAVYIGTFALQRIVSVLIPESNLVFYGHWWALTIGLVALWRKGEYKTRAIIALAFVTGSTGVYALMGEPGYPLVFLVEHLLVLTAGALLRKSWVMWWGVVSVVLAVLYFLRDYTFLAPLFLGILLIIFVVWRLTKIGKK